MFRVRLLFGVPLVIGLIGIAGTDTRAGGFYVREQSTSALATAMAGAAAQGPDASHMYYNPATILDAGVSQLTVDVRGFFPNAEISAQNATSPFVLGSQNITGLGGSGEMTDPAAAPALYATQLISKDLAFGIGISAPFNVVIESDPQWAGEFQLVQTDMRTVNINPVLAYRVAPWMDVAVGFQLQRFETELRKVEALPVAFLPNGTPIAFAPILGFVKGHGYGYGYNAGVLLRPTDTVSVGLSYRSHVEHRLRGSAGAFQAGIPTDGAKFNVTTPDVATLALKAKLTQKLTFLAQAEWSGWSRFEGFRFRFDSGRPDEVREQEWRDTWFGAVGFSYQVSDATAVSVGASYDQAAAQSADNTLAPDGDRTLVSAGVSHSIDGGPVLRLSYAHMFIKDASIDVTNASGTLVGTLESDLDIVGVSATWSW